MSNKIQLGIMQGRLLPKYKGRFQAHPVSYWSEEFPLAQERNLDLIEFILDFNDFRLNPLVSSNGLIEIKEATNKTGVKVKTICADYFMIKTFHKNSQSEINDSINVLNTLIRNSKEIGVEQIIIPCVDSSSLKKQDFNLFITNIKDCLVNAEKQNISICLETDLNPEEFSHLLSLLPYESVKVNYDIGNSASLGYDIEEEFYAYGDKIINIHIKDRLLNGGSAELGSGDVDFDQVLNMLKNIKYEEVMIMQSYRDDIGVEIFDKQLKFIKDKFFEIL